MTSNADRDMKNLFSDRVVTCPVCGKTFIREVSHMYKVHNGKHKVLYFCRYNHYVQWLKKHGMW